MTTKEILFIPYLDEYRYEQVVFRYLYFYQKKLENAGIKVQPEKIKFDNYESYKKRLKELFFSGDNITVLEMDTYPENEDIILKMVNDDYPVSAPSFKKRVAWNYPPWSVRVLMDNAHYSIDNKAEKYLYELHDGSKLVPYDKRLDVSIFDLNLIRFSSKVDFSGLDIDSYGSLFVFAIGDYLRKKQVPLHIYEDEIYEYEPEWRNNKNYPFKFR